MEEQIMSNPRRQRLREMTVADIKATARQLMAAEGTAGLSMRAIARQLGMAPTALYNYFESRDTLITALIVDSLGELADILEGARDSQPAGDYMGRMMAVAVAYRDWALAHQVDFQLIYGNPIPGYVRPSREIFQPARRGFALVAKIMAKAMEAGVLVPDQAYQQLTPHLVETLSDLTLEEDQEFPLTAIYLTAVAWSQMHGRLSLELAELIQPVVGDPAAFYRLETLNMLRQMGMKEASA